MYLLEYLEKRLTGDAWTLGRQLMYMPWHCDLGLLKPHVPRDVFARFAKVQRYCRSRMQPGAKARFLGLRFHYVALNAFVVTSPDQMVHAQSRLLEMHDSFVGQAVEDLSKEELSFRSFSPQDQAAFISLYALSCFCLWALAGIVVPRKGIIPYQLAGDERILEAIRLYWFGHHWSFHSNIADIMLRATAHAALCANGTSLEQGVRVRHPAFVDFVGNTLDKTISFHGDFVKMIYSVDKALYTRLARRTELICYLYLMSYADFQSLKVPDVIAGNQAALPREYPVTSIHAAGFLHSELDELFDESEKAREGEALIVRSGPGTLRMGMLGLKYGLISSLNPMLAKMTKRGDWFDKKYIPAYLNKRVGTARYRYGQEVTAKSEKEGKYDIDLIVTDETLERLYFCQIKHRVASLLPYFRDELDEYAKNKQLNKAVDQLLGSRSQFGDPVFLKKIRASLEKSGVSSTFLAKINQRFLEEHTGFIVIHTIENLDFALKHGVAFYEWNTFRNLLRGELTRYSKEKIEIMNLDLDDLALDDPNRLSNVLMELVGKQDNDNPLHPGRQLLFAMNSYLTVKEKWSVTVGGRRIFDVNGAELAFPIL
jgi:hypothetical protein